MTALVGATPSAGEARSTFLARKVVEDGHYLPVVRRAIQEEAVGRGLLDPPVAELPAVHERITRELDRWARTVHALEGWHVRDAYLPWGYTFTVDFVLERGVPSDVR